MKTAAFIPIRSNSVRVPGKNFRILGSKPLYQYIIDAAYQAKCFDAIFIDSDNDEVRDYCNNKPYLDFIEREEWYTSNEVNGNDLLVHHYERKPDYDIYAQLFVTAPFLKADTIRQCIEELKDSNDHDSVFTATEENGWFWFSEQPVNFRPDILPRSQDSKSLIKESSGIYAITKKSLERYRCRIGANPIIKVIDYVEAVDLDTEYDFEYANWLLNK